MDIKNINSLHQVDPELLPLLRQYPKFQITSKILEQDRRETLNLIEKKLIFSDGLPVNIETKKISSLDKNQEIRLVIITPTTLNRSDSAIIHFHGGGHVMGAPEKDLLMTRQVASELNAIIVSVGYRLSPETTAEGAILDAYSAFLWVVNHSKEFKINPKKIGVMGESAGGGLAASLAIFIRDQKNGLSLSFQNLMYPMLDDRTCIKTHLNPNRGQFIWTQKNNSYAWRAYLGLNPGAHTILPYYAVPSRVTDLTHLPPTYIGVGDLDLFLDENIEYAKTLTHAGVQIELNIYPGAVHAFDDVEMARISQLARRQRIDALKKMLNMNGIN